MSGFDINQLTITGNLTADPELRNLPSGKAVCNIRIAHNDRFKNASGEWDDRPHYFNITIWDGLGEYLAGNLAKGDKVVVAGRLQWREWETEDGAKRQAVDIVANSVVPAPRNGKPVADADDGFENRPTADDDIPF